MIGPLETLLVLLGLVLAYLAWRWARSLRDTDNEGGW